MKKFIILLMLLLVGCSQNKETMLEVKILDEKIACGENLYKVPNKAIEEANMQYLSRYKDYLVSFYNYYDEALNESIYKLRLISVVDGSVVKEVELKQLDYPSLQINDQYIAIDDLMNGHYKIYDENLDVYYEGQYEGASTYMNKDASILYHFNGDKGIIVEDINTKETKTVLEDYSYINVMGQSDQYLIISFLDTHSLIDGYGLFDLDNQTIIKNESPYALDFVDYGNNTYVSEVTAFDNTYQLNNQYFTLEHNPILKIYDNGCFSSEYTIEDQLYIDLYDLNGNHILNTVIDDVFPSSETQFVYFEEVNGYFFNLYQGEHDNLYFIEINDISDKELEFIDLIDLKGNQLNESLYDQAIALSEKYGVNIYVGDVVFDTFDTYDVTKSLDEALLKQGLEILDQELKKYPDTFLKQLKYSNYYQLDIHLADTIEYSNPEDEYDLGNVIGFSQANNGRYSIVLEIDEYTLATTLHHELSHFIDDKIRFASLHHKELENYEEDFKQLNPIDFAYPDRYNDLPSYIYDEEYSEYFIDYYSMTYQKEDKARLFENIMSGNKYLFENKYLKAKLDYYSQYIRKVYDLPSEKTLWEEL